MEKLISTAGGHVSCALQRVEQNDSVGAVQEYGKAADALNSALIEVLAAQACTALDADNVDVASSVARRATAIDPDAALGWYWYGMATLRDGRAKDAITAFEKATALEKSAAMKAQYSDWVAKAKLAAAGGGQLALDRAGEPPICGAPSSASAATPTEMDLGDGAARTRESVSATTLAPAANAPRMDWYQSATHVTVDVFAKQVDVAASRVDISEHRLVARLVRPGKEDYVLERDLFGPVVVEQSGWSASKFKAEIKLKKAPGSGVWKSLAASGQDSSATELARMAGEKRAKASSARQKNWEAMADEELKEAEEKDPMALFKSIYADGDEDARRAMMKSYQESGGKVLSTNWKDVGSRRVEYEERS